MHKGYNELVDYVEEGKWQIFGTLTFRYDVDFRQAEKTLNTFWNIIDRKLFGNLSYRKNIRIRNSSFKNRRKSKKPRSWKPVSLP